MDKKEKECGDMADVCELAHERTVRDIGEEFVYCKSLEDCGDDGNLHKGDEEYEELGTHYGSKAQEIFNNHYDYIINITGI